VEPLQAIHAWGWDSLARTVVRIRIPCPPDDDGHRQLERSGYGRSTLVSLPENPGGWSPIQIDLYSVPLATRPDPESPADRYPFLALFHLGDLTEYVFLRDFGEAADFLAQYGPLAKLNGGPAADG
jgi:hypothetical protein